MAKRESGAVAGVRRRVPEGGEWPARFDDLVRAEPPLWIEWNSLRTFNLKRTADREVVPFLHLWDGALVAFWYREPSPAVVCIDHDGLPKVVAGTFDDFLLRINAKRTGIPDVDECGQGHRVPGVRGKPAADDLTELQQEFEQWFRRHSALVQPTASPEAEALRQRVFRIVEQMIRDGRSKVYNSGNWWDINFQVRRDGEKVTVTYLDYGKWYPVPAKYKLVPEVRALLQMAVHKKRRRYDLKVIRPGHVFLENGRELQLAPGDRPA